MLPNINLLYIGSTVLLLIDNTYIGRFWTCFEAWLAFQNPSPWGLNSDQESGRYHIVELHNAKDVNMREQVVKMWKHKTPADAHAILSRPDIAVTNKRDKDVQLPKIEHMADTAKMVYSTLNGKSIVWYELASGDDEDEVVDDDAIGDAEETVEDPPLVLDIKPNASAILNRYRNEPLNVISVCGKLRTGKSYLMNSLMEANIFGVSDRAKSFTEGAHLSSLIVPYSKLVPSASAQPRIAFVDMEGQSDKGQAYDIKLATPLLIVSKVVLLNVHCAAGPPKEEILQTLNIMILAASQVRSSASKESAIAIREADADTEEGMPSAECGMVEAASGPEAAVDVETTGEKLFGHLHIILRDCDNSQDECFELIFGKEQMTKKMSQDQKKAIKDRNHIREEIHKTFESQRVWCLPRLEVRPPENYREAKFDERASDEGKEKAVSYVAQIDLMYAAGALFCPRVLPTESAPLFFESLSIAVGIPLASSLLTPSSSMARRSRLA